jgi:hypothetical protein
LDFRRDKVRVSGLDVRRVPTFIFVSGGEEIRRRSGYLTRNQIRNLFRSPDSLF